MSGQSYPRVAYTGLTPGADTNNYTLFTTLGSFAAGTNQNFFEMGGVHKVVLDLLCSGAGTVTPYKSADGGKTWKALTPELISGPIHREYPVEGIQDFQLVWTNGGAAQTDWIVDVALSDIVINPGTSSMEADNAEALDTMENLFLLGYAGVTAVTNIFTSLLGVLPWSIFHTTAATRANGYGGPLESDSLGNLKTVEQFATGWTYANMTTQTTTNIKGGAGVLHAIVVNTQGVSGTITIWDNTTNSGTKIGIITLGSAVTADAGTYLYDVAFLTGLTITTAVATSDITISFL